MGGGAAGELVDLTGEDSGEDDPLNYVPEAALAHVRAAGGGGAVLQFQQDIVDELLERDGLTCIAEGLGLVEILALLLKEHTYRVGAGAVLILGLNEFNRTALKVHCKMHGMPYPPVITAEVTGNRREEIYRNGGPMFVTTRIAAVDILREALPPSNIQGVIVANGHRVTDMSQEAFVVRLFRSGNRRGFLRALTDRPGDLTRGFSKVDQVMKCLMTRQLNLWPRFQLVVRACLDAHAPEVVELRQPLSNRVKKIQEAIVQVMEECMTELKKSKHVDTSELTVEAGLFKSFDRIIQRQLDPVWNVVSRRVKQVVWDLRTLRNLANFLLRYDAVTFLRYLETLRLTEGSMSMWMFTQHAHTIFEQSRRRVYALRKPPASGGPEGLGEGSGVGGKRAAPPESTAPALHMVLEPMPKWRLIEEIVKEIDDDKEKLLRKMENLAERYGQGPTLIVAKDEAAASQLTGMLLRGSDGLMRLIWEKYLRQRKAAGDAAKGKEKPTADAGAGGPGGAGRGGRGGRGGGRNMNVAVIGTPAEREAIAVEADRLHKETLRKARAQNAPAAQARARAGHKQATGDLDPAGPPPAKQQRKGKGKTATVGSTIEEEREETTPADIYVHALTDRAAVLATVRPSFIIVHDPDAAFIREIEVHAAHRPGARMRVYFMVHDTSVEEQRYLSQINYESDSFANLIRGKAHAAMPFEQEGRVYNETPLAIAGTSGANTRIRGGQLSNPTKLHVVVDTREFMSSLPSVLHQSGFKVMPCTLEVGDYVLSPSMCVERKSLPDLIESLRNSRLVTQMQNMCRHYKIPILLIEFERDKAFGIQNPADVPRDLNYNTTQGRLALLIWRFPKMRVMWSRSLHMTARMFADWKYAEEEPTVEVAAKVGVPQGADAGERNSVNQPAIDMLRRLPGVTDSNYRRVLAAPDVVCLADLAELTMERMQEILGDPRQGRTLYEFLHAQYPVHMMGR
ncbi:predicted protein [Micromonas commoda]|uniref:ERCC4 domain-containing protein n=1 Tax=Micromonas commoda (strain RCC299 / NOUM17 / CCMP2709) TaxID=296587 RepID=C1E8Y3_MICCC|nr:predicted protein [Micromonas commoda]ACO64590.1 predicted protein [Micromonas commoda]|eukprot:XP_002503332.1 predicted protein [Micromonas commoda]